MTGVDILQEEPFGLDGSGVTVMIYDSGQATKDDYVITVPVSRIHAISQKDGSDRRTLAALLPKHKRAEFKTIALKTEHKLTIRKNPTTQVLMQVVEWPGQTFLLWFPEVIDKLHQEALKPENRGYSDNGGAALKAAAE